MKKTLIAGAASFALAAMPVIGVFATDPADVVDTLTVTVNESCTFARQTGGSNEFTHAMEAGALKTDFGHNTFKSQCNNGKGYTISAVFADLAHTQNNGEAITYSATTPTANSGTWTASKTSTFSNNIAASNGVLGDTTAQDPAGGTTYDVYYAVSLHDDQAQGTYTGTATYTLTQKS